MKIMTKLVVLLTMIAMFGWGCGGNGGTAGPALDNNSNENCDAQTKCEEEGFDYTIPECTLAASQAPAVCETFELCGETISCHSKVGKPDADCNDDIVCPEGSYQVDSCNDPAIADNCSTVNICNRDIFCVKGEKPECDDKPVCPDGLEQTDQCSKDDAYCEEVSLCGNTIQCQKPKKDDCEEKPVCGEGSKQISEDDCTKLKEQGLSCNEVKGCNETIYCADSKDSCNDKPVCADGTHEVLQADCEKLQNSDLECGPVSACEQTIYCADDKVACNGTPVCPRGTMAVDKGRCNFDKPDAPNACQIVQQCEIVLYCMNMS